MDSVGFGNVHASSSDSRDDLAGIAERRLDLIEESCEVSVTLEHASKRADLLAQQEGRNVRPEGEEGSSECLAISYSASETFDVIEAVHVRIQ